MGLLDRLPNSNLGLKGATPAKVPGSEKTSTMHYESSINNTPKLTNPKLAPSSLDLDGKIPTLAPLGQKLPYDLNRPI